MKPTERQKICTQCDGRIPVDAAQCLYCGADTTRLSEPSSFSKHQALEESLTSLYKPQYNSKSSPPIPNQAPEPKGYEEVKKNKPAAPIPSAIPIIEEKKDEEGIKEAFWSIFSLSLGGLLLTISLLQLFFEDGGKLVLEWNAKYWFLYALISIPLIYVGIKNLNKK